MVPKTQTCEWCWTLTWITAFKIHHPWSVSHFQSLKKTSIAITWRENMRNQHQHRARPSVVHIACYRLGLLLHQRQGEMRTGFARDHALSGGFLPRGLLAPSTSIVPSAFIWRCLERGPCVRVDLPHLYSWATCYKISIWESNVQTRRQGQTVTSFCVSGPPRLNSKPSITVGLHMYSGWIGGWMTVGFLVCEEAWTVYLHAHVFMCM